MDNYDELRHLKEILSGNISPNDYFVNMLAMVSKMTQEQFMKDAYKVFEEYKSLTKQSMENQTTLINAMKPFMNENQVQQLDTVIRTLNDISAYGHIVSDLMKANNRENNQKVKNESDLVIEDNTVYEIDKSCVPSSYNNNGPSMLFPLLMMFLGIK